MMVSRPMSKDLSPSDLVGRCVCPRSVDSSKGQTAIKAVAASSKVTGSDCLTFVSSVVHALQNEKYSAEGTPFIRHLKYEIDVDSASTQVNSLDRAVLSL